MSLIKSYYNRIVGNIDVVELNDFKPPQVLFDVIHILQDCGYKNPIVHGGALRDSFIGRPFRDIDVAVSNDEADQDIHYKVSPLILATQDRPWRMFAGRFVELQNVSLKGIEPLVDLKTLSGRLDVPDFVKYSDATINAIGMNADGKILAHPQFESDLKNLVYRPIMCNRTIPVLALPFRYHHFRKKFPGMTLGIF